MVIICSLPLYQGQELISNTPLLSEYWLLFVPTKCETGETFCPQMTKFWNYLDINT